MKKFVVLSLLTTLLIGGLIGYVVGLNETQYIKVEKTLTESTDDIYIENGDKYIELTNGSWIIINEQNKTYEFQPIELGDWSYEVNSLDELQKIVETYINIHNIGQY